jgi:tRNA pseudouridine38-40 synthase
MNNKPKKYLKALGVEYLGINYCGWQRQTTSPSVQQTLEEALTWVADETIVCQCAGRTDSGVHAGMQVVSFEHNAERDDKAWILGVNAKLPNDISVRWVKTVDSDFNARFSAQSRSYRYLIHNSQARSALLTGRATRVINQLDETLMAEACPYFYGEQDFSSVRAANCQSKTAMRNILNLEVRRNREMIIIEITANAFLYHMVRNIAGVLIAIGEGKYQPNWVEYLLQSKDRTLAPATASAEGLYLTGVEYPKRFELNEANTGHWLWEH